MPFSIGFLTGSEKTFEVPLSNGEITLRKRRTAEQMFFQPYKSEEEFINCAYHTFVPIAIIGLAILNPILTITIPAIIVGLSFAYEALIATTKPRTSETNAPFSFKATENLIKELCQVLIDIVVLPLSALVMLTRGVSTGLQAAGICREKNLTEKMTDSLGM